MICKSASFGNRSRSIQILCLPLLNRLTRSQPYTRSVYRGGSVTRLVDKRRFNLRGVEERGVGPTYCNPPFEGTTGVT
ncbi:hypothetical protein NDU88_004693 [Pleurodeles waltl]|uniref:Uncharacterized protein n=1 Tax=Pleurodeles waltl TaxID=8319 RepID=A0AAV7VHT6_PLEWA|nr:hypothetical protein NDU88_004693 [Pleurodeles waltl]